MEDIFKLLSDSDVISEHEILSLLQDEDFYYLKIKSVVGTGSILHIKIYLSDEEYNYSFHWQQETGELIKRWDNAPHHKELSTFPHHAHTTEEVKESYTITLNDVLKEIKERLKK
ncbi:MAG: hypothetical protein KAW12_05445 [Candidatus Aminicenantes bacterium]|nr:hypothetical protein [Candidatus Aminicenantes bacterium]